MSAVNFKVVSDEMSGRQGSRNSFLLFIILFLIVSLGAWAYFTELDNVTRGEGRVISEMQNQKIQAAEGGVILRRYISEGSRVSENEILFEIDPIDANSELNRILQRKASLQIKEIRLRAEIAGEALLIPTELNALASTVADNEESLFLARKTELAGALAVLDQRLVQRRQDLLGAQAAIETLGNTLSLLAQEIAIMEPLVNKAIAPETRLLELRRELEQARGTQSGARTTEASARAGISETESEMRNRQDAYILSSMEELSKTVAELSELEEALPALEDRVGRTVIRAPVAGIISLVNFRTTGGYVNRGEIMVELVPDGDLVIEAQIKPKDISNIRIDDLVRIRFSAYDSGRYGTVDGRVTRISPDAVQDRNTELTYYLIDVAIEGNIVLDNGSNVDFIPGMTAIVDVLSGKRSILQYLWEPIARVQELALRD